MADAGLSLSGSSHCRCCSRPSLWVSTSSRRKREYLYFLLLRLQSTPDGGERVGTVRVLSRVLCSSYFTEKHPELLWEALL